MREAEPVSRPDRQAWTPLSPTAGLLAAAALHLGFQAVVTAVVYPALAEVPPDRWPEAHAAHSRRISGVVAPVYALLGVSCLRSLRSGPPTALLGIALSGAAAAGLSTAVVAAPSHRRLGRQGPTREALHRLRRADGVRLLGAGIAAAAALADALTGERAGPPGPSRRS
jgi:hypothetical protein